MKKFKVPDPRIWIIAILISAASAGIAALLGASLEAVSIMLVVLAAIIAVLIDKINKPAPEIIASIICSIIIALGAGGIRDIIKGPEPPSTPTPEVITESASESPSEPTPEPPSESASEPTPDLSGELSDEHDLSSDYNHAESIWESTSSRYGRDIAVNIRSTRKTIPIGGVSTYKLDTKMDKICRRFKVKENGILSFDLIKNEADEAVVKDVDDWTVSIVRADVLVLYEGTVNRNEDAASFECPLSQGDYTLVIQRTTGNNAFRVIDIDSTFHRE